MGNFKEFYTSDLSGNVKKPNNVVKERTDRWRDGRTHRLMNEWAEIITVFLNLVHEICGQKSIFQNFKFMTSGQYDHRCVYRISQQSIHWLFSYRTDTIAAEEQGRAAGGRQATGDGRRAGSTENVMGILPIQGLQLINLCIVTINVRYNL